MRRPAVLCLALVSAAVLGAPWSAAQVPAVIEVTALDKDGRPVRDLAPADFDLTVNGRPQPVRAATPINTGTAMVGAVGPTFDKVTPAPPIAVYRLSIDTPLDRSATLVVNVKRIGVTAIANLRPVTPPAAARGPAAAAANPNASPEGRLRSAIATGRADSAIAMTLGTTVRRGSDPSKVALDVSVDVPPSTPGPLTAMLGVVNARGGIGTARKQVDAPPPGSPYEVVLSVPLEPGTYKVRFAVADAAGAIGLVESGVEARLIQIGPLQASTLRRTIVNKAGTARPMSGDTIPADAKVLGALLELYGGADAPHDVLVQMALAPATGDQSTAIERMITPEMKDGLGLAEAEFPLDRLAAGKYVLRATVLSGATRLGVVSVPVER